jgi:hypothetical protein
MQNESEVVASEIWGELKRFVNTVDRAEAAETVVQILMDNDRRRRYPYSFQR